MRNPDLDIRYDLPDALAAIPESTIKYNGYDYSDDAPPLLMIHVLSDNIDSDLKLAIEYLQQHQIFDNNVLDASTIYISADGQNWSLAFPSV
jgi:hypothetical protein